MASNQNQNQNQNQNGIENNDQRWSLQGTNALVTGGTKGIGYYYFLFHMHSFFHISDV